MVETVHHSFYQIIYTQKKIKNSSNLIKNLEFFYQIIYH
jgi:hypothetical protein